MKKSPSFDRILLIVGAVMLLGMAAHFGIRGLHVHPIPPEWDVPESDPRRGRNAIELYGCGACHVIPGIRGANGRVGPKLEDFRNQIFVAGMLPNVPDSLIRWIQGPRDVNPGTAMPNLNVSEQDARDIAAYLYALRR